MCCSPRLEKFEEESYDGECEVCGENTYKGDAQGCTYSPIECETCGYSPCDMSC